MDDRSHLLTEQRLSESMALDRMSVADAVAVMHAQNLRAVEAVGREQANIARAVELAVASFRAGGRLIYVGAGTSGRLGVLDASECPPTFSVDPSLVQAIIAGGSGAVFRSVEGAEDSDTGGASDVDERNVGPNDTVCGIAAGGTTPYVWGALRRARERGAKTVFVSCVAKIESEPAVDVAIRLLVGPEVVTGSTRLKAGTATKLVLNTITTLAMVQIGKTYENLMVDLQATNRKLRDRAARIIATITGLPRAEAFTWLDRAGGNVKVAIVMHRRGVDAEEARRRLTSCQGRLREAMGEGR